MKYLLSAFKILILSFAVFEIPHLISPFLTLQAYFFRIGLMFLLCIEVLTLFKSIFYSTSIKDYWKSICFSLTTLIFLFIFLETAFMFVPRSHGIGYTYSSKLWTQRYWKPVNSYGFRDKEPKNKDSTLLFVGDSYTAGHGINYVKDRFSNIVGEKLPHYNSINIGKRGLDTQAEYKVMTDFIAKSGIKPMKIILQYCGNDIEDIAQQNKIPIGGFVPYADLSVITRYVTESSYLINYFYWLFPHSDTKRYYDFLCKSYGDSIVFSEHLKDLKKFIDYAVDHSSELMVVVFPYLQSLDLSEKLYTNKIISFFNDNNVKTIDVKTLVKDLDIDQWVVNKNDGHPSVKVNQLVADEIIRLVNLSAQKKAGDKSRTN
jgi:hypothetical protein